MDLLDGAGRPLVDGLGRILTTGEGGANLCLGWRNEALTGPIVASVAAPGFGPEMLQDDQGSAASAWQTPQGYRAVTLRLVRPAGTAWRAFALARTNLTQAATVRWSVLQAGGVVWQGTAEGPAPGYGQSVLLADAGYAGDTLLVEIIDEANPDGFLSIALLYAGPVWQPERNYGYASARVQEEGGSSQTTRSGAEYTRTDWLRRGFDLVLGAVAPQEVVQLEAIDRRARSGTNLLLVPNPAGPLNLEAVFGRCKPGGTIGFANNSARTRTWRATIMERL